MSPLAWCLRWGNSHIVWNTNFVRCVNTPSLVLEAAVIWYKKFHFIYSGTSIYRSRNDRFPACAVRNFWSRMKFHINNVTYSRIHRSPNYRFPALIVCKSRSRRSISRMDHLKKKNWSKVFINGFTFSLDYKFGNTVIQSRFARGPQLRVCVSVTSEPYFVASGSVLSRVISSIWFICFH